MIPLTEKDLTMHKIAAFGEILFDVYANSRNLGGAPLNFIYHINKLTGFGKIISRVGNDPLGEEATIFLTSKGLLTDQIQKDDEHETGTAIISLNEKGVPTFHIEQKRAYDFININKDATVEILNEIDCLYFGTLAQRNEVSRMSLHSLFNKPIKYFCDVNIRQKFYTKEILSDSLNGSDVVKLNLDELKLINDLFINEQFEINSTSRILMKKFQIEMLAVTKGTEGSSLFRGDETNNDKPEQSTVVDTVGAGDAFASILCLGYLNNWELGKINKLANEFAVQICMIEGALPKDDKIYIQFRQEFKS
jgi:fructokinase